MITDLQFAIWVYDLYYYPGKFDKIIDVGGVYTGIKYLPDVQLVIDRGSVTLDDWFRDALSQVEMVHTEYGGVGGGFNVGMDHSDDAVIPLIDHDRPVILGGHSLGGSHADLRAASWRKRFPESDLTLIKFGSPRTGDLKLRDSLSGVTIRSYVNGEDEVTKLPKAIPGYSFTQTAEMIRVHADPIPADPDLAFKFHHIQLYVAAMALAEGWS